MIIEILSEKVTLEKRPEGGNEPCKHQSQSGSTKTLMKQVCSATVRPWCPGQTEQARERVTEDRGTAVGRTRPCRAGRSWQGVWVYFSCNGKPQDGWEWETDRA